MSKKAKLKRLGMKQIARLKRLLYMKYKPSEIASEIGIKVDRIYKSYIPAGCPHVREDGHIWLVGDEFAAWAKRNLTKQTIPIPADHAWCFRCKQSRQIVEPEIVEGVNRYVERVITVCEICGTQLTRFRSKIERQAVEQPAKETTQRRPASLINRDNWKLFYEHLDYLEQVRMIEASTLSYSYSRLRHVLEWLGRRSLAYAPIHRPTFPRYLQSVDLARSSMKHILVDAKRFFAWLYKKNQKRYGKLNRWYLDTLRLPRAPVMRPLDDDKNAYTVEDMLAIMAVPVTRLSIRRNKAAVAFMFLSGIRSTAFVTMPLRAVDISENEIRQWVELGVKPKNQKSITSYLLQALPELLEVVADWDQLMRSKFDLDALWFSPLSACGTELVYASSLEYVGSQSRYQALYRGVKELCVLAGIEHKTPHKLRHGHAVYGLEHAGDIDNMDAVSKNMGHADLQTTLKIYTKRAREDIKSRIENLGKSTK